MQVIVKAEEAGGKVLVHCHEGGWTKTIQPLGVEGLGFRTRPEAFNSPLEGGHGPYRSATIHLLGPWRWG